MTNTDNPTPLVVEPIELTAPAEIKQRATRAILLVPEGWPKEEAVYAGTTESVRKLARANSLPMELLESQTDALKIRDNRSADWIAPTMFISSTLLSENPTLVSISLNVLSNYVTELFKGLKPDPKVEFRVLHQDTASGKTTRLKYSGPVSGVEQVAQALRKLHGR